MTRCLREPTRFGMVRVQVTSGQWRRQAAIAGTGSLGLRVGRRFEIAPTLFLLPGIGGWRLRRGARPLGGPVQVLGDVGDRLGGAGEFAGPFVAARLGVATRGA